MKNLTLLSRVGGSKLNKGNALMLDMELAPHREEVNKTNEGNTLAMKLELYTRSPATLWLATALPDPVAAPTPVPTQSCRRARSRLSCRPVVPSRALARHRGGLHRLHGPQPRTNTQHKNM